MELPIPDSNKREWTREDYARYQALSTGEKFREIQRLTNLEFNELFRSGRYEEVMRIRNEQKAQGLLDFFARMKEIGYWIESDERDCDVPILCSQA